MSGEGDENALVVRCTLRRPEMQELVRSGEILTAPTLGGDTLGDLAPAGYVVTLEDESSARLYVFPGGGASWRWRQA